MWFRSTEPASKHPGGDQEGSGSFFQPAKLLFTGGSDGLFFARHNGKLCEAFADSIKLLFKVKNHATRKVGARGWPGAKQDQARVFNESMATIAGGEVIQRQTLIRVLA